MQTLTIFTFVMNLSKKWSLYVELELAPLLWLAGIGYEAPVPDALVPCHRLMVHVPTFRLDFRMSKREDLEKARVFQAQVEAQAT